jgi:hypothetical protein
LDQYVSQEAIKKERKTWEENEGTKLLEDRWRGWLLDNLYKTGNEGRTKKKNKIVLQN